MRGDVFGHGGVVVRDKDALLSLAKHEYVRVRCIYWWSAGLAHMQNVY